MSVDSAGIRANVVELPAGDQRRRALRRLRLRCLEPRRRRHERRHDVFVHDRQTGTTERVSVDSAGNQASRAATACDPAISADGRFVAFDSDAANLVAGDTNGAPDVFVHDRPDRHHRAGERGQRR